MPYGQPQYALAIQDVVAGGRVEQCGRRGVRSEGVVGHGHGQEIAPFAALNGGGEGKLKATSTSLVFGCVIQPYG